MSLGAGSRLGPYEIIAPLGQGGMGAVYRARDARLQRDVAVKVVMTPLEDGIAFARFQAEALATARVSHPNITAIFDTGQHEGRPYLVSELLDGETVRARLNRGPIRLRDALQWALQIAAALAAAHDKGIVHRDLKPENLFVTNAGTIKVLDFGLAKLREWSDPFVTDGTQSPTADLASLPGVVLGTIGYMAPEQLRGAAVDHRADLFSFGVVLYELLSGARPFARATTADVISAVLGEEPPPLPTEPGGAFTELEAIARRCLQKDPRQRFQSSRDLAFALEAVAAGGQVRTRPLGRRAALTLLGVSGVAASAYGAFRWFAPAPIDTLAVIPLSNATGDPALDYLTEGLTDTLVNRLSGVSSLSVMARSTVARHRADWGDPQNVGERLGVQAVLTGRVVGQLDAMRVALELVDVSTGAQLWGADFSRSGGDLLELQDEIISALAERLGLTLSSAENASLTRRATTSSRAYDAYLRGRFELNKRTEQGFKQAVQFFDEAIRLDPSFAGAYSGLADCYGLLAYFGMARPADTLPRANEAARAALRLNDQLAEVHTSLAMTAFFSWDWTLAEREFQRAMVLDPRYATAPHWYSHYLVAMARWPESRDASLTALKLEPLNANLAAHLAWHHYYAREHDDAVAQCGRTLDIDPAYYQAFLFRGMTRLAQGRFSEAVTDLEQALKLPSERLEIIGYLGQALAKAGFRDRAEALHTELSDSGVRNRTALHKRAMIDVGLGRLDAALTTLEACVAEHVIPVLDLAVQPAFDAVREHDRYRTLVRNMKLPERG